jgi:hypothetical protein
VRKLAKVDPETGFKEPVYFDMPTPQAPAVSDVVVYCMTPGDVAQAEAALTARSSANPHQAGEPVAAVITRVNDDGTVNLHLLLDGPATHWVSDVPADAGEGSWTRA